MKEEVKEKKQTTSKKKQIQELIHSKDGEIVFEVL